MLTPNDFGDKLLLSKISDGNEGAFRQIFIKYAPFLQIRLSRLINARFEQEDIIQETFLRVWLHRDQLPEIQNWQGWLLRICYNRAFTHLRRKQKQHREQQKLTMDDSLNETQESVDLNNLKNIIALAILDLPPQQKKIYQMNREQGLTIAEISDELQLSVQTVKNHLSRALKSIRSALVHHGYVCWTLLFIITRNYF